MTLWATALHHRRVRRLQDSKTHELFFTCATRKPRFLELKSAFYFFLIPHCLLESAYRDLLPSWILSPTCVPPNLLASKNIINLPSVSFFSFVINMLKRTWISILSIPVYSSSSSFFKHSDHILFYPLGKRVLTISVLKYHQRCLIKMPTPEAQLQRFSRSRVEAQESGLLTS